jgi:tRNA pseudouridine55 synthase
MTSHDVVAAVRRLTGLRSIGHTGTLDPEASGVLVLCLGRATRLARFFETLEKTYWAVMQLGVRTDTQDATGVIMSETQVPVLPHHRIAAVLWQFTGPLQQIPPMYSAVKYRGQRLYHLARQGHTVTRQARSIVVQRCELLDVRAAWVTLAVTCSKGTYIRTLCDDIGQALGCGAHLVHLQRCRVGAFCLRQAYPLAFLQQCAHDGTWAQLLIPAAEALSFLPTVTLTARQYEALRHGPGRDVSALLQDLAGALPPASGYLLYSPTRVAFAVLYRQVTPLEKWKLYYLEPHGTAVGSL